MLSITRKEEKGLLIYPSDAAYSELNSDVGSAAIADVQCFRQAPSHILLKGVGQDSKG